MRRVAVILWIVLAPLAASAQPYPSPVFNSIILQNPLPLISGGWGLATLTPNAIYKGNGINNPLPSSISDNGTTVSITEPLALSPPLPITGGGWGLATLTSNAIYKGNGASTPVPSSLSDNGSRVITTEGIQLAVINTSSLPSCVSGLEGTKYGVNDATSAVFNATFSGSGTNHIIAYCNGTAWTVH